MSLPWRWKILPAILLLLLAGQALAKGGAKVKLLILDPVSPFMQPAQLSELGTMLRNQAKAYQNISLVTSPPLDRLKKLAGCHNNSARCIREMGRAANARRVLFSQIQKLPGRHMVLLKLIDVRSGKQIKANRQRSKEGQAAALKALRKGWVKLFGRLVDGRISVQSNVADARIFFDGRPMGQPPLIISEKMLAGRHVLRATHPDYKAATRKVRLTAKKKAAQVHFNMVIKPGGDIAPVALVAALPKDEGPGDKLKDEGPGDKLKDEGPGDKLKDEGPGDKLKDEGPGDKLKDEGPGDKIKDDGPGDKPKDQPSPLPDPPPIEDPEPDTRVAMVENTDKPYLPDDEARQNDDDQTAAGPYYKQWWFWTAVGAVVVGGVVTGAVLGTNDSSSGIPSGKGRLTVEF